MLYRHISSTVYSQQLSFNKSVALCLVVAPAVTMTCFPSSASASSCSSSSTSHLASPPVCAYYVRLFLCPRPSNQAAYRFVISSLTSLFGYLLPSVSMSLQQSLAEVQQLRAKALASPTQEATGFLLKDSSGGGGSSKNSSSCDTDDFVMVPAHFTSKNKIL